MKDVVEPFVTVVGVLGLMVPLLPAEGVTLQVWMFAEQLAVVPPFAPVQLQVHGPVPVTALALPAVHRLALGAAVKVPLFAVPHSPLTGVGVNVATTEQFPLIAFVV